MTKRIRNNGFFLADEFRPVIQQADDLLKKAFDLLVHAGIDPSDAGLVLFNTVSEISVEDALDRQEQFRRQENNKVATALFNEKNKGN